MVYLLFVVSSELCKNNNASIKVNIHACGASLVITQAEMQLSLSISGTSPCCSLQSFHDHQQSFLHAGENEKKVKEFYNLISEPFFDVPPSQVGETFTIDTYIYNCIYCIGAFAGATH